MIILSIVPPKIQYSSGAIVFSDKAVFSLDNSLN